MVLSEDEVESSNMGVIIILEFFFWVRLCFILCVWVSLIMLTYVVVFTHKQRDSLSFYSSNWSKCILGFRQDSYWWFSYVKFLSISQPFVYMIWLVGEFDRNFLFTLISLLSTFTTQLLLIFSNSIYFKKGKSSN